MQQWEYCVVSVNGRRRRDGTRMDWGTGLSERAVRYGLDNARTHQLIEEVVDDSDRGRVKKSYRLRMRRPNGLGDPSTGDNHFLQPGVQSLHPQVQALPPRGAKSRPRTEKDTLERHSEDKHDDDDDAVGPLVAFGVSPTQAQRLATTHSAELILNKLDLVTYLVEKRSPLVSRNPQGFLVKAIELDYLPEKPRGYRSKAEREAQTQQRQEQEIELEQARLEREQAIAAYKQQQRPKRIPGSKLTTRTTWEQVLTMLQGLMTAANFNTWLKHTVLVDYRDGRALIAAPSNYVAEWLRARMNPLVQHALFETLGQTVQTEYLVMPELTGADGE